ncbi:MAG: exo-beta-N-acetylmuramidase NamZ domain-containing protein, partial [Chthoniobacteraceae bacterium]
ELAAPIAPTTKEAGAYLRGRVHDPTAQRMGGVAGHAGLFSTAKDLARFARMLLGNGSLEGAAILKPEPVALMTAVQTPAAIGARRGFGWDIDSPYSGPRGAWFPLGSFGHTGWTGSSLWIDPFSQTFVIFLSNRNHPTEAGNVISLRRTLGTLAAESVRGFNFTHVPGALPWQPGGALDWAPTRPSDEKLSPVLTGIDNLARDGFAPLKGLAVGLVTNQTGINRERLSTIDLLHKAPEVKLTALFSPEHGIRGLLDEKVGDGRDEKSGLPIYSLYGARRAPTPEQLAGLDALVFDIADIGCRFYTYLSTLGECMIAARKAGKKVFVLDRPNPITGARVEGPMLTDARSFVAWHEIPIRHGMTVGELARMLAAERAAGIDLTVIPCTGWTRGLWFDATALPWTNPSPNMRNLNAATLYPGVGLLEFCQVSVGRGTDRPFEVFGAPYIDDAEFAAAINDAGLDGIRVIPTRFTPSASVFAGQECRGVQFVITDREAFSPLDLGMTLATTMQRLYAKDVQIEKMAKLLGHPATLEAIKAGKSRDEIKALWAADREAFRERREKYLLYR